MKKKNTPHTNSNVPSKPQSLGGKIIGVVDTKIEAYLSKPYWVIDLLPQQVPPDTGGQYFKIERYMLEGPRREILCQRLTNILIKLNCYDAIHTWQPSEHQFHNPSPAQLTDIMTSSMREKTILHVLFEHSDAMISFSGDDTYMTLYNAQPAFLELTRMIAASEGMFVWQPPVSSL